MKRRRGGGVGPGRVNDVDADAADADECVCTSQLDCAATALLVHEKTVQLVVPYAAAESRCLYPAAKAYSTACVAYDTNTWLVLGTAQSPIS